MLLVLESCRKSDLNLNAAKSDNIINKEEKNNKENEDNEEKEEDEDILSKFRETQKKEEIDEMDQFNFGGLKNNKLSNKMKLFRKSTLRAGMLGEDNNENFD